MRSAERTIGEEQWQQHSAGISRVSFSKRRFPDGGHCFAHWLTGANNDSVIRRAGVNTALVTCYPAFQVGKENSKQADHRKERTYAVDQLDAGPIGTFSQHCGPDATHPEGQVEEKARNHTDPTGHQLLSINKNCRERRRQHELDQHTENERCRQADIR
jgi:hypothetical protein